jgi:hypothetical protein
LQDYVKWNDKKSDALCPSSSSDIWQRIVIVRYGILTPFLLLYLAISYTDRFMKGFLFGQLW